MLVKEALVFGKISTGNSKMPGTTYAIDAFACNIGAKLRNIKGSVCSACYAIKLQKLRPSVDSGYKSNLEKWLSTDHDQWVDAMVFQIKRYNTDGHHRWFDAGDLQSEEMLHAIVKVCKLTPEIKHWLPTREKSIVSNYLKNNDFPDNLVVRVSSAMVNGEPLKGFDNTSTVHYKNQHKGTECLAYTRSNSCGDCRACWSKEVQNISYKKH